MCKKLLVILGLSAVGSAGAIYLVKRQNKKSCAKDIESELEGESALEVCKDFRALINYIREENKSFMMVYETQVKIIDMYENMIKTDLELKEEAEKNGKPLEEIDLLTEKIEFYKNEVINIYMTIYKSFYQK